MSAAFWRPSALAAPLRQLSAKDFDMASVTNVVSTGFLIVTSPPPDRPGSASGSG
jgi:hypothetical protein